MPYRTPATPTPSFKEKLTVLKQYLQQNQRSVTFWFVFIAYGIGHVLTTIGAYIVVLWYVRVVFALVLFAFAIYCSKKILKG